MGFLEVTGSGFTFIGKNGKNYKVSPLSLMAWGNFVTWVQYKPYRDALVADLPKQLCDEILTDCRRGKVKEEVSENVFEEFPISLHSTVVREAFSTLEGTSKLLQLSILENHPEIIEIPFGEIIDLEKAAELQAQILRLNQLIDDEEEEDKESEKN